MRADVQSKKGMVSARSHRLAYRQTVEASAASEAADAAPLTSSGIIFSIFSCLTRIQAATASTSTNFSPYFRTCTRAPTDHSIPASATCNTRKQRQCQQGIATSRPRPACHSS